MNPNAESDLLCPCDSGKDYTHCCGPIIKGKSPAETAEALMRSRYTAFTQKNWDYLVKTTHPNSKAPSLRKELEENDDNPQWSGLEILSTTAGTKSDKVGKVMFEASYFLEGKFYTLAEHSRFKRAHGEWKYVDAKA